MSQVGRRHRLRLNIPDRKHEVADSSPSLKSLSPSGGSLSPDLQPSTPPTFPNNDCSRVSKIGKYFLLSNTDTVHLQSGVSVKIFKSVHTETQEELVCKVVPLDKYRDVLSAYWCVGTHDHINEVEEILLGETQAYVFFARNYGDLHSYIRAKRKLKEAEASRLFNQIVSAVRHCHQNGIVLRDLKLRKFVFKDAERTQLKLEGLEDACVLDDEEDDRLSDKHGCPAYVSPEILNTTESYSGRCADTWSLGVILYTILIGRYPFQDSDASALFTKIRRGLYTIPDTISSRAKCLIRSLLRMQPQKRLLAGEILQHPWLNLVRGYPSPAAIEANKDQAVPDIVMSCTDNDMAFGFL